MYEINHLKRSKTVKKGHLLNREEKKIQENARYDIIINLFHCKISVVMINVRHNTRRKTIFHISMSNVELKAVLSL